MANHFDKFDNEPNYFDRFDEGAPQPSAVGEIANQLKAGTLVDLPQTVGQALEYIAPKGSKVAQVGQEIAQNAKIRGERPDLQPRPDEHGAVVNALASGARMIPSSVAPALAVGGAIAASPFEVPAAAGLGIASLAGGSVFGLSQAQQTYDKATAAGLDEKAARSAARKTGLIEGAGETLGEYAGGKLFGIAGKVLRPGIEEQGILRPFLKQLGKTAAIETGTEVGQNAGEAAVEQQAGIDTVSPYDAGVQAIGPTLGMTALMAPFGLAGHAINARRETQAIAADPIDPSKPAGPMTRAALAAPVIPMGDATPGDPEAERASMQAEERAARTYAARDAEEQRRTAAMNAALDPDVIDGEFTDVTPRTQAIAGPYIGQTALPAPSSESPAGVFVAKDDSDDDNGGGSGGGTRRATYAETAESERQAREADSINGAPTGIKTPPGARSELRERIDNDGKPFPTWPAANAALKKLGPDAERYEVTRLDKGQFVVDRKKESPNAATPGVAPGGGERPSGEPVRSAGDSQGDAASGVRDGRPGADAGPSVAGGAADSAVRAGQPQQSAALTNGPDTQRSADGTGADAAGKPGATGASVQPAVQNQPGGAVGAAVERPATIRREDGTAFPTPMAAGKARKALTDADQYDVAKVGDKQWELRRKAPTTEHRVEPASGTEEGAARSAAAAVAAPTEVQPDSEKGVAPRTNEAGDAPAAPPPAPAVPSASRPGDWKAFDKESGTLGIPRADMPQVKSEHRGALVAYLRGKDVKAKNEEVDAKTLKPTQAEYSPEKVETAKAHATGDRSILVSSDNHIVDGHHQWLARRDSGKPIKVIRLQKPIKDLLPLVKEFPSAEASQESSNEVQKGQQAAGEEDRAAVPGGVASAEEGSAAAVSGAGEEGSSVRDEERTPAGKEKEAAVPDGERREAGHRADVAKVSAGKDATGHETFSSHSGFKVGDSVRARGDAVGEIRRIFETKDGTPRALVHWSTVPFKDEFGKEQGEGSEQHVDLAKLKRVESKAEAAATAPEPSTKKSGKPRLAESAEGLHAAIKKVNAGVTTDNGVLRPVVRIVPGGDYVLDKDGSYHRLSDSGGTTKALTAAQAADLESAISKDQVQVVLLSRPGYGSGYKDQKVVQVLHEPSGNSFAKPEAKSKPPATPKAEPKKSETEDAGAELWYNRRNRTGNGIGWTDVEGLNDALKVKEVTKSKVWPRPDYEQLVKDGMHAFTAHLVKQVYDALPTTPTTRGAPTDADLKAFIEGVQAVREAVFAWARDAASVRSDVERVAASSNLSYGQQAELSKLLQGASGTKLLDRVFPDTGKASRFTGENHTRARLLGGNKFIHALQFGVKEYRKAADALKVGWPAPQEAWEKSFEIRPVSQGSSLVSDDGFYIASKKSPRRNHTGQIYKTREEAVEAARELAKRGSKEGGFDEYEATPLSAVKREGAKLREPNDNITSERLQTTFGFKGVNFGNWMKGDSNAAERQAHLNHAYDAFLDLADVLEVPPKALGLNGMLGLAFGAQGRGGSAAAHFVPGVNEINLTRTSGAGALAHEWGHALDHYFAVQAGAQQAKSRNPFISELAQGMRNTNVRPEVVEAFRAITRAMEKRAQTAAERDAEAEKRRASGVMIVNRWIEHFRKQLDTAAKPEEKDRALAAFDELAARLRRGDTGEGSVTIGRTVVSDVAGQLRTLYQDTTGQPVNLESLSRLDAASRFVRSATEEKAAAIEHFPQVGTAYKSVAAAMDEEKGGRPYWATRWEMFARAFESYVMDRLAADAARNDYLVRIGKKEPPEGSPAGKGYPYPRGDERKAINAAFDKLVETLDTKDTDSGTALFKTDEANLPAARKAVVELVVDKLRRFYGARGVDRLLDSGVLKIVASRADLPKNIQDAAAKTAGKRLKGVYDPKTKTAYIVASEIEPDEALKVLLHEVGEHYGLRQMLGKQAYVALQDEVRALNRAGNPAVRQAWNTVLSNYKSLEEGGDQFVREVIAHLGERPDAMKSPIWKRIVLAVRRWLWKNGIIAGRLTDEDVVGMVVASLRRAMSAPLRGEGVGAPQAALDRYALKGAGRDAFITLDGSEDWARVPAEAEEKTKGELNAYPIRLQQGEHYGPHRGFGLKHIEAEHGEEIRKQNLSPLEFVRQLLEGASKVYAGDGTRLTVYSDRTPFGIALVELRNDGKYYSIVTAYRARPKGKLIWSGRNGILSTKGSEPSAKGAAATAESSGDSSAQNASGVVNPTPKAEALADQTSKEIVPPAKKDDAKKDEKASEDPDVPQFSTTSEAVRERVGAFFEGANPFVESKKRFNWWDRTIGTQFNKAARDKDFKRVFDRTQRFLTDVSRMAQGAADLARDIFPRQENPKEDFNKWGASPRELRPVGDAVFTGTLTDSKVYSDAELVSKYKLNPKQIRLYRQARAAIDRSLEDMGTADMVRLVRSDVGEAVAEQAAQAENMRRAHAVLAEALADPKFAGVVRQLDERLERVRRLQREGYAPLMRFGSFTVDVRGKDGEQLYFGLFETEADQRRMEREMRAQFPDATITADVKSMKSYKLFKGLTPDTLELFAELTGMDHDEALQQYLKVAIANRSAMKRLIHRKGIAGFSPDLKRVLADFLSSNARSASRSLHTREIERAIDDIPQGKGDVKDEAIDLWEYVSNPKEEATKLRSFLFFHFIGGSIASAAVNMTQPLTMTLPYLSQWGTKRAGKVILDSMKYGMGKPTQDAALKAAMDRASREGVIQPHQIFELQAAASRGTDTGRSSGAVNALLGENTADRAREILRKLTAAWGRPFSMAESFNRRLTFAAAFQIGRKLNADQLQKAGVADAYEFATLAVNTTQGIFNRGNRPNWGRGALGASVLTFKTFAINYVEMLARLPRKQQIQALGVLVIAAGVNGLPGADDLDDVIDTLAQRLGLSWNTQAERDKLIRNLVGPVLGEGAADFISNGMSAIPGVPLDVQGRLGMGNLVPGTGVALKSQRDPEGQVLEVGGAATSALKGYATGAGKLLAGDFGGAAKSALPLAVQNMIQAYGMAQAGFYKDSGGKRVIDTTATDAFLKGIGFQPSTVANESRRIASLTQDKNLNVAIESEISSLWAQGIFEKDRDKVQQAMDKLASWNRRNPASPIRIQPRQVFEKVKSMRETREQRFLKSTPRELRGQMREALAQ